MIDWKVECFTRLSGPGMSTTALDIPHNEIALARTCGCAYSLVMKVIENRVNNRTGEPVEVSWGNAITSDFSVVSSVLTIIEGHRLHEERLEDENHNPILDRFTTVGITIEF